MSSSQISFMDSPKSIPRGLIVGLIEKANIIGGPSTLEMILSICRVPFLEALVTWVDNRQFSQYKKLLSYRFVRFIMTKPSQSNLVSPSNIVFASMYHESGQVVHSFSYTRFQYKRFVPRIPSSSSSKPSVRTIAN